ncbi:hypothetical protein PRUB_b0085 [Pseudoalteromonas rubra]|uniref:Uncharacterized protein n=1 Tax=Pseudoalteromonas rubra TaxID=43658 RepID=A0A8T0C185_9GAMM|nr:hypothetical protein PRUB_b0085 [Pseudoalteromonas rubra]
MQQSGNYKQSNQNAVRVRLAEKAAAISCRVERIRKLELISKHQNWRVVTLLYHHKCTFSMNVQS